MANKVFSEQLCIAIHKEVELNKDGQPNIIWPDDQCTMPVVCFEDSVDESISLGNNII